MSSEKLDYVLCWLATVDRSGQPNVSPKEVFCFYGDKELLIANIASPKSVTNIREQEKVCVSMIDVFRQKGTKLTGSAKIVTRKDAAFSTLHEPLSEMAGKAFRILSIIHVEIESEEPIVAPSYHIFADRGEDEQISLAKNRYGLTRT